MEWTFDHPWELGLLIALLLGIALELGFRTSAYFHLLDDPNRKEQIGTMRDGLFVLASLLIGFTLALAGSRFAERRLLLIEEVTSIGTTYLRAETLPQPYRDHSQRLIRDYVNTRLDLAIPGLSRSGLDDVLIRSQRIQDEIWTDALAVAQKDHSAVISVYLNSLNDTIDLNERRIAAHQNRIPLSIWTLIVVVAFMALFTRGLSLMSRFWPTLVVLPMTIAIVVALMADLDAPNSGLIRLDQRSLERLKTELKIEPRSTPRTATQP